MAMCGLQISAGGWSKETKYYWSTFICKLDKALDGYVRALSAREDRTRCDATCGVRRKLETQRREGGVMIRGKHIYHFGSEKKYT